MPSSQYGALKVRAKTSEVKEYHNDDARPGKPLYLLIPGGLIALAALALIVVSEARATDWRVSSRPPYLDERIHSRYCFAMTTEQLIADAMALPISERVSLAQELWESIDAGLPDADERSAIVEAVRRDWELSSGRLAGRSHAEVMQAAPRALKCE